MQNWNQWQLSAGAVATPMPQPPVGYATAGADPMAMMQSYMQYFSQPAPSGYTAEQWTAAQQQNWAQWQQWQQQYQQWQAQYGEKYQETMKHMSAQSMNLANQVPQVVQPPPPLPKEDSKPPLPPTTLNAYQFTSMPPPHQNNLPLFPAKQNANTTGHSSVQNCPQNPPLPPTQPPLPPDSSSSISKENNLNGKRGSSTASESTSAKKLKIEDEELTEAEKTFDAQFKQWEEQFNKWKEQNANHPDKTQYKQYEAKWTSWREKLIERREQMRRKREQQKQAAAKADVEKCKSLPGDDKIMNILSSTENQGLINNLLGIGKSLGLTGKQNSNVPPPPPPPPATQAASPSVQTATITSSSQLTSQSSTPQLPGMSMMSPSTWNSQQWTPQYNAGVNVSNYSNYQPMTGVPPPSFGAPQTQMSAPNFAQPPPSFSNVPNFSQPPPGFTGNDSRQNCNLRPQAASNMQGRPPALAPNNGNGPDESIPHNERPSQAGPMNSFESNRQKDGVPSDRIGRDSMNDQPGNQFRPTDAFGQRNESYKLNDERAPESEQFRREDRSYQEHGSSQFSQQKLNFSNDRYSLAPFGAGTNRFAPTSDRFGMGNDRPGLGNDRSVLGNDRFGPGNNKFGNDRFAPGADRLGQGNEPANDRFGPNNDRFGSNNEPFGPGGGDRFNRSNLDRFESKDVGDRRDSFPNASRSFARNDQFKPPDKFAPELKKLMEKRRAALDVFKPSYLDSDKSCNVGSLSESFKKITGESPFMKSSPGNNNFGPRGPPNFGPAGCGNYRMPVDFKPPGNPEFGPRCPMGIVRNNSFDSRDGGIAPFRGPNSSPQLMQDFMSVEPRPEIGNIGHDVDMNKGNIAKPIGVAEQVEVINLISNEQINSAQKECPEIYPIQNDPIPLLEKPLNWGDGQFPQDNSLRNDANSSKVEESLPANYNPPELGTQNVIGETAEKQDLSNNDTSGSNKEADVLPFMGENDPKPEDLNMEPPPELPNLGPVSTDNNESNDPLRRMNEPYDAKDPSSKPFPSNPECFDPRETFDATLGPRGMQFRPNAPFPGSRGPNDRLPVPEPRGPSTFNSPGPGPHPLLPPRINIQPNNIQFGPRGPNDGQFGPRGPNDGQFGLRGPNDGQFGPRGPNDAQFGARGGPNDGQFGPRGGNERLIGARGSTDVPFAPRGPNEGPFAPRGLNDGPFSSRAPIDLPFGPRGSMDNQFAPRGSIDNQFVPRNANNGQFGIRGSSIGQFGPRYDEQFAPRRLNDVQFGPRGPSDGQFVPQGPNNRQFAPGRPNDTPFDNRSLSETQLGPRGPNEGQLKFPGPTDRPFEPRRNEAPFQRSLSGSTAANPDAQFPNRFNERQFDAPADGSFAPQKGGSADTFFGSRPPVGGPIDAPFAPRGHPDRPFDARGLGDFRLRGQVDNGSCPKPRETSEPGGLDVRSDGGAFEATDRIQIEQNAQQGQFDSNEKQKPGWRPPFPKSNFSDVDQRPTQDFRYAEKPLPPQSDAFNQGAANNLGRRSPPNPAKYIMPDKRPEKGMPDLAVGDYKARYGESSSGSDYSKFNTPNVYMKRPIDNRQSQVRCSTVKEFCIEKQFNYNHGGATAEKKFVEHIPAKVIDYAHTSRTSIQDHLTPVQCFDYGHGNLKPLVPEHEPPPKTDFRNWEESEQNLKEYTDKIRTYEHYSERVDSRRSGAYNQRRNSEELIDDKKPERDRRENAYKGKEREDKIFDRVSEKDQENRYDKNAHKERTRERFESSQKEANKDSNKDEDRSKGNINWQENSSKSIVETKPLDTSVTDTQHNVVESAPKTLELAKTPNCTMVDDLLCPPGRQNRPPKIAIILRGPPGSGKSFVAKLIKDKEVEQGGSAPRILSLDDYFLVEKEIDSTDDNGKKVTVKEMAYEYEEAMEQSYVTSLVKAFKKNITDGFFNFIILDCINEKISDYEEMWSFAKTKGFKVYVCEMEMDLQICLKRNIHNRTEDEINRIIDYFEPTPSYHQKLDVNSMLQEQAIEEVHMEDSEETQEKSPQQNEDSQDSQEDILDSIGVSKWERMEAEDKLDRLDGLAKKKNEGKVQTMQDFLQVPDYYNMEDTSGKKRVRWADLEERKEQEKMRAVGFVVGHTNWDRMMDPTKGGSALTRTKGKRTISK
ncbi:uncharacterized protein LOC143376627 isoform X2 [Andrena cerasifolii]|uniref:uncharacterized protein LOC143376627 isoform X2 n=1 Tax=Andrena cerasifolii TaxID=2819439 RepID=UPI0040381397